MGFTPISRDKCQTVTETFNNTISVIHKTHGAIYEIVKLVKRHLYNWVVQNAMSDMRASKRRLNIRALCKRFPHFTHTMCFASVAQSSLKNQHEINGVLVKVAPYQEAPREV